MKLINEWILHLWLSYVFSPFHMQGSVKLLKFWMKNHLLTFILSFKLSFICRTKNYFYCSEKKEKTVETFFKLSLCSAEERNMWMSKLWEDLYFWVNYLFKPCHGDELLSHTVRLYWLAILVYLEHDNWYERIVLHLLIQIHAFDPIQYETKDHMYWVIMVESQHKHQIKQQILYSLTTTLDSKAPFTPDINMCKVIRS